MKKKARKKEEASIPFVRGFRRPTPLKCARALGYEKETPPKEYDVGENFFRPIPDPKSIDDWLAQYNEEGQTYDDFLDENPWLSSRKRRGLKQKFNSAGKTIRETFPEGKIYLLPLGDFSVEPSPRFDLLIDYAEKFFQVLYIIV